LKLFKPIEQRPVRRSIRSFSETSPSAKIADQFLLSLLLLVLAVKYFQVLARSSRRGRVLIDAPPGFPVVRRAVRGNRGGCKVTVPRKQRVSRGRTWSGHPRLRCGDRRCGKTWMPGTGPGKGLWDAKFVGKHPQELPVNFPRTALRWYAVTELGVASPELPGAGSVPDRGENPCEVLTDA
jgi:hypothetical protein